MDIEAIEMATLKEVAKSLNQATYEDDKGNEVPFIANKIKVVAVTKEKLAQAFFEAVRDIDDDVVNELPEEIIDFYNDYFADEPEKEEVDSDPEPEPEPEDTDPEPEPEPEKKKAPGKKESPPKEAKEKKKVELSCFGHKVGSQAAAIDDLLNTGKPISAEELSKKSGRALLGTKAHIKHLRENRGLTITEKEGVYQFVKK